jgi:hypothetical protein
MELKPWKWSWCKDVEGPPYNSDPVKECKVPVSQGKQKLLVSTNPRLMVLIILAC